MTPKLIKVNLLFCAVLHGLNHYLLIFYKPMYPQISDFFGLSAVANLTIPFSAIYVGYALSNFFTGILARKYSLKYLLFFGMLLMSISTILFAFVPAGSYGLSIILIFLMGLGGGTYHPAANTFMTTLYEERQGHAIGILSIGSVTGFIVAPLVGTYIGRDLIGFHALFLASGAVSLLFCFFFLFFVKDITAAHAKTLDAVLETKKPLPVKAFALIIVLLCIPATLRDLMGLGYYEITPFWVDNDFSSGIGIQIVQLMAYAPGIIVQPLAGKICDRLGSVRILVITILICCVGYAALALILPAAAWVGLILYGIGMSASTVAGETYMASVVTRKNRGLVYGVVLSVSMGVGGFLGGTSGWVVDQFGKTNSTGYQLWFVGMGILLAASLVVYPAIQRIRKKHG
jgi:MFS family permease